MASRNKSQYNSPRRSPGDGEGGAEALERASAALSRNIPPQNLEAEQAVLGGVFLRNSLFHSLVDVIRSDDFYSPAHKLIFRAFEDLYSKNSPVDLVTVTEQLTQSQQLDSIGGPVYLAELASSPVSAANALHHAAIVRDKAISRRLIEAASEIIGNCYDSKDVESLLDQSEQSIFQISDVRSKTTVHTGKELVDRVFKELEKRVGRQALVTGITTGYEKLDEMTAGLQNSDLIIVAARPSMATSAAVSKSMIWGREAMMPFFISTLTTSAPVFFMREASSPTEISSGIWTLRGAFFAISSCSRRIFSCSSWRRLLEKVGVLPRVRLPALRNFSLPCCIRAARSGAICSSFSS